MKFGKESVGSARSVRRSSVTPRAVLYRSLKISMLSFLQGNNINTYALHHLWPFPCLSLVSPTFRRRHPRNQSRLAMKITRLFSNLWRTVCSCTGDAVSVDSAYTVWVISTYINTQSAYGHSNTPYRQLNPRNKYGVPIIEKVPSHQLFHHPVLMPCCSLRQRC
jgi:hypothetical protein